MGFIKEHRSGIALTFATSAFLFSLYNLATQEEKMRNINRDSIEVKFEDIDDVPGEEVIVEVGGQSYLLQYDSKNKPTLTLYEPDAREK